MGFQKSQRSVRAALVNRKNTDRQKMRKPGTTEIFRSGQPFGFDFLDSVLKRMIHTLFRLCQKALLHIAAVEPDAETVLASEEMSLNSI